MIWCEMSPTEFDVLDIHGHYSRFNEFHTPDSEADSLVKIMDRTGIRQLCIAPFMSIKLDCRAGNRMTREAMEKYPDRILGHACVNPFNEQETISELQRCFEEWGFHAIKLHPYYNGMESESSRYNTVFEYANAHSLTILWHYGASAAYLKELAAAYKNVNFVVAHYGGSWDGYRKDDILDLVRDVGNIYTDTASSVAWYGAFERLIDYVGAEKILFGSDAVFLDAAFQLGRINGADVERTAKEKVLGDNFKRLLAMRK
ncbi:MAG: amidohydrolase family protein [Clostridiaceae bacterium]